MGGKIGVDIFVLISGYFLINDNNSMFNFKRILKIWGQIFFYSITLYLISIVSKTNNFEIKSLIKVMFPITRGDWWFASTYFVLYLLHPFINKMLNILSKHEYQCLLIVLVVCWSIIPTFLLSQYESNNLLWFITLYAIAGYARKFGLNNKLQSKHYFILWFIFSFLTFLSNIVLSFLGTKQEIFASYSTFFFGQEKISVLLISLSLFMAFATLKMKHHKFVNIIASATFGVYLIHDSNIIRPFLWIDLFKNAQYQNSLMIIPYSIIVVLIVFILCTIIDLIRQKLFEKPFLFFVNKYSELIIKPFAKVIGICKSLVFGKENQK